MTGISNALARCHIPLNHCLGCIAIASFKTELPPKFRLPKSGLKLSHFWRREMKIAKQAYTIEFKDLAVKRIKGGRASAWCARNWA